MIHTFKVSWHTKPSPAQPYYEDTMMVSVNAFEGQPTYELIEPVMRQARQYLIAGPFRDCPGRIVIDAAKEV